MRSYLLLFILASLAACGDGTGPSASVAGNYNATTFILTRTGIPPTDVLAAGGSMIVGLTEDGTAGGNVFIPGSLTGDGQDFEVMMTGGTYTRSANTVRFQHDGDSFVEDMVWTVGPNTLSASLVEFEDIIEITLTRSPT
jgi:hypothetical protein